MTDGDRGIARWVLLDGNRHLVAAALLVGIYCLLLALGAVDALALGDPSAVRGVATGMIPGLFAFLSIVLAINQLVLSQELGSAGEARQRNASVREFRRDVEAAADTAPSPILPIEFLAVVVRAVAARAETLRERATEGADPEGGRSIASYAESVIAAARGADEDLQRATPGRINAVLSVLEYDESTQLYRARRLRREYGDALSADTRRTLDELIDALELFSVARTQFRTTYTQRVLARLSRLLLYVGIPAILAAISLGLARSTLGGALPAPFRMLVVAGLLSAALSPIAVLFSYMLRIAAVSERTVAEGPFVSRPGAVAGNRDPGEPRRADASESGEAASDE